jgi:hypothetical protein
MIVTMQETFSPNMDIRRENSSQVAPNDRAEVKKVFGMHVKKTLDYSGAPRK